MKTTSLALVLFCFYVQCVKAWTGPRPEAVFGSFLKSTLQIMIDSCETKTFQGHSMLNTQDLFQAV